MEMTLVYAALGLAGLTSAITLFLFMSRVRLQEKNRELEDKLLAEQSRRTAATLTSQEPKKKPETAKVQPEKNKHAEELVELRKTNAHLKDEIRQLKQEVRHLEVLNKDSGSRAEMETFKLRAENQALLERARDLESNSTDKKRAQALEHELTGLKENLKSVQSELAGANAKLKSERHFADKQKLILETMQNQLKELKARLPEDTQPEVQKIDPKTLERWKDRALTARHMYRMMRQMRELSDLKLFSYQEAVYDVSRTLLSLKGAHSPEIGPHENKADRFLAEAWSLVQSDTSPNA
ncbi:MAG: hypothetical protein RI953_762 [Pseudomonadota bacterium]|jgi:predicted  nucleic acid-binding Zn-ribbon protein